MCKCEMIMVYINLISTGERLLVRIGDAVQIDRKVA